MKCNDSSLIGGSGDHLSENVISGLNPEGILENKQNLQFANRLCKTNVDSK